MSSIGKSHLSKRQNQPKFIKIMAIMCLLTLFVAQTECYDIKDFHQIWPWLYKSEGLYEVDIGLKEPETIEGNKLFNGMMVLAIGDLDDNKHTDIVTLSDDQHTITVHFYNDERMDYKSSSSINLGECKAASATLITAPPYRLAILCTEQLTYEYIKLLEGVTDASNVVSIDLTSHKLQKGSQPMFLDINSDSYSDFIYNTNSIQADDNIRVVYFNYYTGSFEANTVGLFDTYLIQNGVGGCMELPDKYEVKLSVPHFSALADLNNDCIADLYLTVTKDGLNLFGLTMIYTKIKDNGQEYMKYCLTESEELSAMGYTSPVFADFDNDAALDKAFYNVISNSITIYYNKISANNADSSSLCKSVPTIKLEESDTTAFKNYEIFSYQTESWPIEDAAGLYTDPNYPFIPGQIRTGDLDSDGKTDVIVTVQTTSGGTKTIVLVDGEPSNDFNKISSYEQTSYAFAMDFDDNGRLDFVVVSRFDNGTTSILPFYNNYSRDSYYVSASIFTHSGSSFGYKPHGVFCRGIYTTLTDSKYVFVSAQTTRTSYAALEDPVATYAIGRSNNFIEDFTVTYHHQKVNAAGEKYSLAVETKSWSPIIPNSNLLIGVGDLSTSSWSIRLLINPTDSFVLVGIVLVILLIIIGSVIIHIHLKEKKEDEENRNPQIDFF